MSPRASKSTRQAAVPARWEPSEELQTRAEKLIAADVGLRSLGEHPMGFVSVENRKDPEGRVDRWLKAVKVPPMYRDITELEAIIAVNAAHWQKLTDAERDVALTHALSHLEVDEKGVIQVVAHDVEAFAREVRKGGAWTPEITLIVEALTMFGKGGNDEDVRPKGSVNADALRGEADRSVAEAEGSTSVVEEIDKNLRKRSKGTDQPQPPAN